MRKIKGDMVARVLMATIWLYAKHGRVTIRAIEEVADLWPLQVARALAALRKDGLVDWEDRKGGTLHPTCRFIPASYLTH